MYFSTKRYIFIFIALFLVILFFRQRSYTSPTTTIHDKTKMLDTIYIVRHGFRSNWVVSPSGEYTAHIKSPTGISNDPPLAAHGVEQAVEMGEHLATLEPKVDRVFSSPFYRCLQTLKPFVDKSGVGVAGVEGGIGEWFGTAPFEHPSPASAELLKTFFPTLDASYVPLVTPAARGETMAEVHDRAAFTLQRMIDRIDNEWRTTNSGPRAVLLCSHAATSIAMGRVLVGDEGFDVQVGTCSLSVYKRRRKDTGSSPGEGNKWEETFDMNKQKVPVLPWRNGNGVGGGWDNVVNGDCSFLKNGEERNWWFGGDEAWDFPLKKGGAAATAAAGAGGSGGAKEQEQAKI